MATTHGPTSDYLCASLYLLRCARSAAVVLLVGLSSGVAAYGQTLTFRNARDLLVSEPAVLLESLEAAKPAPLSMEDMLAILRALPAEGEVTKLGPLARKKVDAIRQLLTATERGWYEIKVIDLPQVGMALHARAVVLIPAPTVELLSAAELQALAAHEIGHDYVWTEYGRARQSADQERLWELELACDAIAAVIFRQLGMEPSRVIDAIEKATRFNRQRFGVAANEKNYPALRERRAFAREVQRWLRDSRLPSRDRTSVSPSHQTIDHMQRGCACCLESGSRLSRSF
jgi:hypothetical protein